MKYKITGEKERRNFGGNTVTSLNEKDFWRVQHIYVICVLEYK